MISSHDINYFRLAHAVVETFEFVMFEGFFPSTEWHFSTRQYITNAFLKHPVLQNAKSVDVGQVTTRGIS